MQAAVKGSRFRGYYSRKEDYYMPMRHNWVMDSGRHAYCGKIPHQCTYVFCNILFTYCITLWFELCLYLGATWSLEKDWAWFNKARPSTVCWLAEVYCIGKQGGEVEEWVCFRKILKDRKPPLYLSWYSRKVVRNLCGVFPPPPLPQVWYIK